MAWLVHMRSEPPIQGNYLIKSQQPFSRVWRVLHGTRLIYLIYAYIHTYLPT